MLNAAIWNVRGLNKRDHQLAVKDIVAEFRLHFLGLLETRVRIKNVAHKFNHFYYPIGNGLWIMDLLVLGGTQFMHCLINIHALHKSVAITVIYWATEMANRRELWRSLEIISLHCVDVPWLVGGDFNAVQDISKICGASGDIRMAVEEFNICIQNAGLLPLPMQGEWCTACLATQHYWGAYVCGNTKTQSIESGFPRAKEEKGDLTHNVQLAKGFLEMAQTLVSSNRRDELFLQLEHYCRIVLAKAAKLEQVMLRQRAKMQWMKGGDQCSRVFFRKIAQRRSARRILQITDDQGVTHMDPGEVTNEFVSYYQNLLGGERRRDVIDIQFLRPWARHLLNEEDTSSLLLPFAPADVKQAVFDIAEDKAPGPDGYSSGFSKLHGQ
ncbi:UNVERIFIED_CONTAM: hypothetical protein Sindi_1294400 [Sesamum indicum]